MAEELPLFVLPMILLPNEVQHLRIFEPRYKQMLDDCLLDGKNFGLVMNDEFSNVNGWDGPRDYGCEAEIIHHETKGSNHFIEIIGRRRFSVKKVIDPALPPFSDESMSDLMSVEGIFPDLETIIDKIPQDSSNSKLYISAEVEYLEETENISENKLEELEEIFRTILSKIGRLMRLDEAIFDEWVENQVSAIMYNNPNTVYSLAAMTVSDPEIRYEMLECNDGQILYDMLLEQLDVIKI